MAWLIRHRLKIALAGILVMAALFFAGGPLLFALRVWMITPSGDFAEYEQPPAPDYHQQKWWAALPDRKDPADVSPKGMDLDRQAQARADVFYVHPTTFITAEGWNQPLGHEAAETMLNQWVLTTQASAFNGCCRVYAPHYRQATIAAFFDLEGNGKHALDLAFGDVVNAFEHYMQYMNEGRPFIIAGHSQGARHTDRLLREVLRDIDIRDRLVAAYTIGQALMPSQRLPVCSQPDETGCQISWNSQTSDARTAIGRPGGICVNPLTWKDDGKAAPASANLGSVDFTLGAELEIGIVDAQCKDGLLLLTEVNSDNFSHMPFGPGNYHRYEFSLYYMNIRDNATRRVEAFLKR